MPGADDPEVSMIERGYSSLIETLSDGHDRSIGQANIKVPVCLTQLADTLVVSPSEVDDCKRPFGNVAKELMLYFRVKPATDQIVNFNDDGRWDQKVICPVLKQLPTVHMITVVDVEGRIQRPGIDYERHSSGR